MPHRIAPTSETDNSAHPPFPPRSPPPPSPADPAPADPATLALQALGWVLGDGPRAERLLALTGLTPDDLRDGLGNRAVLAAVLDHLAGYEPDLIAVAQALEVEPQALVAAARELAR